MMQPCQWVRDSVLVTYNNLGVAYLGDYELKEAIRIDEK